jgi:tetratricopeptide (TPR) repeat protein
VPSCRNRWKRLWWLLAVLLAATVLGAIWWRSHRPDPAPRADLDPRLTYDGPLRNIRPDVQYAGDQACAECHAGIVRTYRQHPMGQSFFPTAEAPPLEQYGAAAHNPFEKSGVRYRVERRGSRVFHMADRDLAARPLFAIEAETVYTLGSGARGRSYLVHRDGFLFQSPVSWYSQQERWDLSPGYAADRLFDRAVPANCLFCHCNDARPMPDTVNRYEQPLFRGHAIGCERCHGPGALHARSSDRLDIVNPARLEPALREAVCEQCHLQGEARVLRRGREWFDYRPGLPLHEFWSVFVRLPELRDHQAVDQVEQMHESRCFQASNGKLGCVSCHDPHALPPSDRKAAYYRDRCLGCHREGDCGLAPAPRRAQSPDDNCAACHMPRESSADIVHTAITDHRVVRRPSRRDGPRRALEPGEAPVTLFHSGLPASGGQDAVERDLGLALIRLARQQTRATRLLAEIGQPKLEAACRAAPHDAPAREALGDAYRLLGRPHDALQAYTEVLAGAPRREAALAAASATSASLGQFDEAVNYCQRALAVNPHSAGYHGQLADLFARRGAWVEAEEACRAALRLNPAGVGPRLVLVRMHLARHVTDQAREEFEKALALVPPQRQTDLHRWYAEQGGLVTGPLPDSP